MKIIVDFDRCEGHGICAEQAPEIFELDDEGELTHHFDGRDLPDDLIVSGTAAAQSCPVAALRAT